MQASFVERRATTLVELLRRSLCASVVRLYGASDEKLEDGGTTLVLLAAASAGSVAGCFAAVPTEEALGRSLAATTIQSSGTATTCADDFPSLLLRAALSLEPAVFPAPRRRATAPSTTPLGDPEDDSNDVLVFADALPLDCAEDHASFGCSAFCALPLCCGTRLLGMLWVSADPTSPIAARRLITSPGALQQLALSATAALSFAAAGPDGLPYSCWLAGALRRLASAHTLHGLVQELTGAVEQHVKRRYLLDLTVHAALVPAVGSDNAYLLTADPAQPVPPPAGVSSASSRPWYRQRTVASVGPLSQHANCRPKSERDGEGADPLAPVPSGNSVTIFTSTGIAASSGRQRARALGVRRTGSHDHLFRHMSTRTSLPRASNLNADPSAQLGCQQQRAPVVQQSLQRANTSVKGACEQWAQQGQQIAPPAWPGGISPARPVRALEVGAMAAITAALNTGGRSTAASQPDGTGPGATSAIPSASHSFLCVAPSALRAKAFKMSHTLLQRLVEQSEGRGIDSGGGGAAAAAAGSAARGGALVPAGLVITSCGRWVQDVRQPSRDVCLMMTMGAGAGAGDGSRGAAAATAAVAAAGGSGGVGAMFEGMAGAGGGAAGGGGGGGGFSGSVTMQSMVLLGLSAPAANGAFMGLYLSFPSQLPTQLLEALRDSCDELLRAMLAPVVAHKLRDQLAAEVDTVRAGVPGSYAILPAFLSTATSYGCSVGGPSAHGRDRDREDMVSGNHTASSNSALAGDSVLPPGRLARTITTKHQGPAANPDVGGLFLSGQCLLASHLETGGMEAAMRTALSREEGEVTVGLGTQPDLVSDLVLTVELRGEGEGLNPPPGSPSATAPALQPSPPVPTTLATPGDARQAFTHQQQQHQHYGRALACPRGGLIGPRAAPQAPSTGGGMLPQAGGSSRSFRRQHMSGLPGGPSLAPAGAAAAAAGGSAAGMSAGLSTAVSLSGPQGLLATTMGLVSSATSASPRIVDTAALSGELAQLGLDAPASVLTVQEADGAGCMRTHMGLLVESLLGTIRSTAVMTTSPDVASCATTPFTNSTPRGTGNSLGTLAGNVEDLDELQLYDVLGEGASGVVLRGTMGTVPVATKLIEIPHLDEAAPPAAKTDVRRGGGDGDASGGDFSGGGSSHQNEQQRAQKEHLNARRTMFRNAMELAVLRSTTHVNIVQCLGVFDNVILEHNCTAAGMRTCMLRRYKGPANETQDASGSPICTAIVTELCDNSLANVLTEKSFPRLIPLQHASRGPPGSSSSSSGGGGGDGGKVPSKLDMRGIYLTVLEVGLALRHLHARRLVHRDLKPANVLLKSSPGDPRGWITKLADFGFTLLLDRQEWPVPTDSPAPSSNRAATSLGTVGGAGGGGGGGLAASASVMSSSSITAALLLGSSTPQQQQGQQGQQGLRTSTTSTGMAAAVPTYYTVQEQACGTVTHMAPEAMRQNSRIDASVDIFALGVLMWDIAAGRGYRPYKNLHPDEIPAAVAGGLRPAFPDWVPSTYRKLAQACWAADPRARPTAAEVVAAVKAQLEVLAVQQHQQQQAQASRAAALRTGGSAGAANSAGSARGY